MNNGNDNSPRSTSDLAWFSSNDNTPITNPPRRRLPRKPLIFFALAIVILLAAALIFMYFSKWSSTCLGSDDYQKLTDSQYVGSLDATNNFYTDTATFRPLSTEYASNATQSLIDHLASFYSSHKNKSIIFTVGASYAPGQDLTLIQSRIDTVTDALSKAGIPSTVIKQDEPILIAPEEPDDSPIASDSVSIAITSAETCE